MIEKIITSKTRRKLLNLFLAHIDDRYYLRELERMLNESLSPLRRQLLRLVSMGILVTEEEANLKYYRLNKNFEGIEELRKLVLGKSVIASEAKQSQEEIASAASQPRNDMLAAAPGPKNDMPDLGQGRVLPSSRRIKYDLVALVLVSLFVLGASAFVVYTSTKNITQVASMIGKKEAASNAKAWIEKKDARDLTSRAAGTMPDEMTSRRWKVVPGNAPAFSTGAVEGTKSSKEL